MTAAHRNLSNVMEENCLVRTAIAEAGQHFDSATIWLRETSPRFLSEGERRWPEPSSHSEISVVLRGASRKV
jgi:hypothetical protein